jgi:hypothetical protein
VRHELYGLSTNLQELRGIAAAASGAVS